MLICGQIWNACTFCWVIWSWYSSWRGWQTESRARGCHRPQTGHRVGIYWAGLHLTLLDWRLIYRTTFLSVCLSAHVCTCVPLCLYTHPEGNLSYQRHWAFIKSDIFCHSAFKPNTWLCVLPHCGTLRGLTYATCQYEITLSSRQPIDSVRCHSYYFSCDR